MADATAYAGDALVRWIDLPGPGAPVLWLHGLGCHGAASWAAAAVRSGRRSIILDLPGHGRSDAADGFGYTLPELAEAVARVAEAIAPDPLAPDPLDVVAHSLGGAIALHFAHARPDLVHRLVLVEPAVDPAAIRPGDIASEPEEDLATGGWARILEREAPWRRADVRLADPVALVRCARALSDRHAERLHRLLVTAPAPVTLIRGGQRVYAGADEIAARVHDVRVAGAGHFVMVDAPEAFDRILRDALDDSTPDRHGTLARERG